MPAAKKAFLCLYWFLAIVYLAAALAVLGMRYLLLPRIDDFRPRIEAAASSALGAPVAIGSVQADWTGLNPRLRLQDVTVAGRQGDTVLSMPQAAAVLSWRSVLTLAPRLLSLEVRGLDLTVRRDAQARLWVAGRAFTPGGGDDDAMPALDHPALQWLLAQRELAVRGATVRWLDQMRGAPELVLGDADILVRNSLLEHVFSLSARPQQGLATGISLRGELRRRLLAIDGGKASSWNGEVYAQLDDAEPAAWRPWFDTPDVQGRVAARAWVDLARGRPADVLADVAVRGAAWQQEQPEGFGIRADSIAARVQGASNDMLAALRYLQPGGEPAGEVALQLQAQGLLLRLPGVFPEPLLPLDTVDADVTLTRPAGGPPSALVRRLAASNRDVSASVQGLWRGDSGKAGSVDLRGTVDRAAMPALHRYIPMIVTDNVHKWLREGLLAGRAAGANFVVRGPLQDFPYGDDPSVGQFHIEGSFDDAVVDYAPVRPHRLAWPKLADLSGTFEIERTALRLRAQSGLILTGPDQAVELEQTQAEIPDMENKATLHLQGRTSGDAQAYLAMMTTSPLGRMLDHALDQARADGQWQVPLSLRVPLYDVNEAEVSGSVVFDGGNITVRPGAPAFQRLYGTLDFSDRGVAARDLQGRFLGGTLRASGELARGAKGLTLQGSLTAQGLRELSSAPVLKRLSGRTDYSAQLTWRARSVLDLTVQSGLQGLAIDLPAPLGKPAEPARSLRVNWGPAKEDGGANRWLTAELDGGVALQLEVDPDRDAASYFRRGAVTLGRPAQMPPHGLALAGKAQELDVAAWQQAVAQFDPPRREGGSAHQAALPPLSKVALETGRLRTAAMDLDDVALQAERSAGGAWQVDLSSRQLAGTAQWSAASPQTPARLTARLDHLALAEPGREADGEPDIGDDDFSDVPDLDVSITDFSLYGKRLGALKLVGSNQQRGQLWQLQSLQLRNDAATLDATGTWQLAGPARGLAADARMEIADLGKLLARLGMPDRVAGGQGTVKGDIVWRNLPWQHRYADLTGALDVSLDKGRFAHVSSRSARLLELLSLQSVKRLARLDFQPGSLLEGGFPFDTIRSHVQLGQGVARTEGLKVNSPVATIVLAGSTDLSAETWDLEAAVVPKLDASGAAIAAGIAVNPLIGLGAFLTQWLLSEPLAHALTAQYAVRGTWDEPKLEPVEHLEQKYGARRRQAEQVEP